MKNVNKLINTIVITGLVISPFSVSALTKKESVYSNLNYNGDVISTSVTNHLIDKNEEIEDETILKEILNINGEETFTIENNKLKWKSKGKDIFYRGITEENIPIKTEIKYYLNGVLKKPEDILGKKGNIKIEINFTNNLKNTVLVNGVSEELYTPFVMTVGAILDNKNNSNININNGKVVDTGSRNVIVGISSPGLYDSLKIEELKSMDNITLTYDTTNFRVSTMYIVGTPKILDNSDFEIFNKLDNFYSSMDTLQSSIDTIEEGSKTLKDGASNLSSGINELSTNLKIVNDSLEKLKNGSVTIDDGLKMIISELEKASSLFDSSSIETSVNKLNSLKQMNNQTISTLVAKTPFTLEQLLIMYNVNFDINILSNMEQFKDVDVNILNENVITSVKETSGLIVLLTANNSAIDETITSLTSMPTKIDTIISTLNTNLVKIENGSNELSTGLITLSSGVSKIYNGSSTLSIGVSTLYNGMVELNNGINKFNKEGINKLVNYSDTMKNHTDKTKELMKLSENYKGFASSNSNSTIFISVIKSLTK